MPRVRAKIKISRKIQNILLKSASENVALDYNWMNNCETLSHFILLFVKILLFTVCCQSVPEPKCGSIYQDNPN